jgi:hypothetical protein
LSARITEHDVVERHDDHERPKHQGDHAIDSIAVDAHRPRHVAAEDGLDRIQRARPDVPEHHAERAQPQGKPRARSTAAIAHRRKLIPVL